MDDGRVRVTASEGSGEDQGAEDDGGVTWQPVEVITTGGQQGKFECIKGWAHVRDCGPVPGNYRQGGPLSPRCICGCSGYGHRCGTNEWWLGKEGTVETEIERYGWK